MAHTNSTENYGLPQWIGTDKPTFLGDFNSAFATIDTGMKASADVATAAAATANAADAVATSAATNATNAIGIANNAASEAASATSAASSATATANTAKTTADNAMRASASNSIDNLAPAYDNTLTYNVGDLVTFIDAQNSGKLYKCIVAVNTPMDFNINYWDDVTTSEVFTQLGSEKKLITTVTADGTKTYAQVLREIYPFLSTDKNYKLTVSNDTNYLQTYSLMSVNPSAETYDFMTSAGASGIISFNSLFVSSTSASAYQATITIGTGAISTSNNTEVAPSSGLKYRVYEVI